MQPRHHALFTSVWMIPALILGNCWSVGSSESWMFCIATSPGQWPQQSSAWSLQQQRASFWCRSCIVKEKWKSGPVPVLQPTFESSEGGLSLILLESDQLRQWWANDHHHIWLTYDRSIYIEVQRSLQLAGQQLHSLRTSASKACTYNELRCEMPQTENVSEEVRMTKIFSIILWRNSCVVFLCPPNSPIRRFPLCLILTHWCMNTQKSPYVMAKSHKHNINYIKTLALEVALRWSDSRAGSSGDANTRSS